jgi:1,4-alpha-glucan branching enzyme
MIRKRFFRTKDECEVSFEYQAKMAQTVALMSDINDWQPIEMKKRRKDGIFYTKVRLPKESQYQFRYLLDGQYWENDPAADSYVPNEYGSDNSVVKTFV